MVKDPGARRLFRLGLGFTILDAALIGLSVFRFRTSLSAGPGSWLGLGGAGLVLLACLASLYWGMARADQIRLGWAVTGVRLSVIAVVIFAAQFLVEYLGSLTSEQDGMTANFTYGVLILLFLGCGLLGGFRQRSVLAGLMRGLWSGLFFSLGWVALLWITFHLFAGTAQETHFFTIDQIIADFQRSGMNDLRAFVVQDYWGATIFHPVLGAAAGALLGALGGAVGKTLAGWRKG